MVESRCHWPTDHTPLRQDDLVPSLPTPDSVDRGWPAFAGTARLHLGFVSAECGSNGRSLRVER